MLRFIHGCGLAALLLAGCGSYDTRGYGWLAPARTEPATAVELPANAPSISQRYRPLPPGQGSDHQGIDILVPRGMPVLAASDGRVAAVELSLPYGKQIRLDHGRSEYGYRLQTRYYHLSEQLVQRDQGVSRGQLIGYAGATGLLGVYPHLHFEVHRLDDAEPPVAQRALDPQLFWTEGPGRVSCFERGRVYEETPARLTYPVPCRGVDWQ